MKEVLEGEIYLVPGMGIGVYHLVLQELEGETRKMFICSLASEANEEGLLTAKEWGIVTPNDNWTFVRKTTTKEYEQALSNFHNQTSGLYKNRTTSPKHSSR